MATEAVPHQRNLPIHHLLAKRRRTVNGSTPNTRHHHQHMSRYLPFKMRTQPTADLRQPVLQILARRATTQPLLLAQTGTRLLAAHFSFPQCSLLLISDMAWNLGMSTRKAEARRTPRHPRLSTTTTRTDHPLGLLMVAALMSTVVPLLHRPRRRQGRGLQSLAATAADARLVMFVASGSRAVLFLTWASVDSLQRLRHFRRRLLKLQKDRQQVRFPASQQFCDNCFCTSLCHSRWRSSWHAPVRRIRTASAARPWRCSSTRRPWWTNAAAAAGRTRLSAASGAT